MEKLTAFILYLVALCFLGIGGYALYLDRTASGTAAVVAALGCIFVSKLDLVEHIKLLGLEATMRKTINEAQATIEQLQGLAAAQGEVIIKSLETAGRWAGGTRRHEKEQMKQSVIASLEELGLKRDKIETVRTADFQWIAYDYATHLKQTEPYFRDNPGDEQIWRQFSGAMRDRGLQNPPRPDEFQAHFEALTKVPQWTWEMLDDYRYYLAHRQHRRPATFLEHYRDVIPPREEN